MREHPSTQAADGAGGDLQQPDAARIDAHLGVHRPGHKPRHAACPGHCVMDAVLQLSRQPGRRDVEGFLEIRPVQRIGLVEQGQRRELASIQAAFQCVLQAGNEVLDDQTQLLGVAVGARLDGAHPVHHAHQRGGIVGADHAAASR